MIWQKNSTVNFSGRNIDFNGSRIETVFILDQDLKAISSKIIYFFFIIYGTYRIMDVMGLVYY